MRGRWTKADQIILQCFVGGLPATQALRRQACLPRSAWRRQACSCRKTASILNRHLGWGLSASLVSRLAGHLHQALERYRHCALQDEYVALIIDGACYRFRQLFGPQRVVLAVLGLAADQSLVLLGFHVARSESAFEVGRLLRDLKERGLRGQKLQLIVADWAGGIESALAKIYPWVTIQPRSLSGLLASPNAFGAPHARRQYPGRPKK